MSETMVAAGSMRDGLTLPALRARAVSAQVVLLLAAAWVLPALAHWAGVPGRVWLPMHWPVIFAGLCYGWRSGALIGLAAPGASYLLSGMPPAAVLPARRDMSVIRVLRSCRTSSGRERLQITRSASQCPAVSRASASADR